MLALKLGNLGQQPERCHCRAGGNGHLLVPTPLPNLPRGAGQTLQAVANRLVVLSTGRRQVDGAGGPFEQGLAEIILKQPYLTTDRALCNVQLLSGKGKTQVPGCSLKGNQTIERRKRLNFQSVYIH